MRLSLFVIVAACTGGRNVTLKYNILMKVTETHTHKGT